MIFGERDTGRVEFTSKKTHENNLSFNTVKRKLF